MRDLTPYLERLAPLHARLCPRQVLGIRMALFAGDWLAIDLPRIDKRLVIFIETDGCFADGVSVVTGCWFGRRTLRFIDHGKVAATFIDSFNGQALRIWPHPDARERAVTYMPGASNRWEAQLVAYQNMPAPLLLHWQAVAVSSERLKAELGLAGQRCLCSRCGEEIMNGRELKISGDICCRGCAEGQHYQPLAPR